MLHEPHPAVSGPAFFVVIPDYVFVVWIWIFGEESLNEVSGFLFCESEYGVESINIPTVEPDWMPCFSFLVGEAHEFVG